MSYGDLPTDAPHKPNKGKEGGACNRQRCQAEPALWFNHGSRRWYCADCRADIEFDSFNSRDWQMNYYPRLGHPMFETRAMISARTSPSASPQHSPVGLNSVDRFEAVIDSTKDAK